MKRKTAQQLNLPILAKFVSFASVGVPPDEMGVGNFLILY
jgi:acetyl-CoA acyltransferase 1